MCHKKQTFWEELNGSMALLPGIFASFLCYKVMAGKSPTPERICQVPFICVLMLCAKALILPQLVRQGFKDPTCSL